MNQPHIAQAETQRELIEFAQQLVRIESLSGQEGQIQRFIESKMLALGYDEVVIDGMGNLLGRIGSGPKSMGQSRSCSTPTSTRSRSQTRTSGTSHRLAARSWMGAYTGAVRST